MIRPLLLLVALSVPVAAQPAPDPDPLAQARQMYIEGKRYYDVGDYAHAIDTWKRAYVASSASMLLFNIGQAYRLSGDCVQALRVYANYEREARDLPNRDELEQAKARCNREPTATNAPTNVPSPPIAPAPNASPVEHDRSPPQPRGKNLRIAGIVTAGAGGALVIASLILAKRASDRADTVSDFHGEWTTEQRTIEREGQRARTWSLVTGITGAAAIVGGGALYLAGRRSEHARGVGIAITPTHAEVQWSVSF